MNTLRKLKGHTKSHQYNKSGLRKTMLDLNIDKYSITKLIRDLEAVQNKWKRNSLSPSDQNDKTELTNWDIQEAKEQLRGLIVSELDKNKAKLYVE